MNTEPENSGERQSEILDEAVRKFGAYVESTGSGESYVFRLTRALIKADISLELMQGAFEEVQKMALEGASVESTPEEKRPQCGTIMLNQRCQKCGWADEVRLNVTVSPVPLAERPQAQYVPCNFDMGKGYKCSLPADHYGRRHFYSPPPVKLEGALPSAERPLCGFDMGGGLKCNEPSGHKPQHKYTDRTERIGCDVTLPAPTSPGERK